MPLSESRNSESFHLLTFIATCEICYMKLLVHVHFKCSVITTNSKLWKLRGILRYFCHRLQVQSKCFIVLFKLTSKSQNKTFAENRFFHCKQLYSSVSKVIGYSPSEMWFSHERLKFPLPKHAKRVSVTHVTSYWYQRLFSPRSGGGSV